MDFGLSEEQRLLEEALRRLCAESFPIERVRDLAGKGGEPADAQTWKALVELGAAGVLVPERFGGAELALLDAVVVGHALGRACLPAPFLGSGVMAPVALLEAGDEAQCERWLPRLASGDARIAVSAGPRAGDGGIRVRDGELHGRALLVIDAPGADAFLVAAGDAHESLALVESDAAGLECTTLRTIDRTRGVGELCLDGVAPLEWVGPPERAGAITQRMVSAARVVLAADLLGASDCALERAVAYSKDRVQFGRVIGSFQAVKHLCAEMAAEIEPARSLVWYAAHAFDEVPGEADLVAAHAKALLSEVGTFVVRTATEVHGGIGFTEEQNLHYWFKRVGLDRQLLGGPALLREEAARLQGLS